MLKIDSVVYTIRDPITLNIVYVGQSYNYKGRISMHLNSQNDSAISQFIRKLRAKNRAPIFEIYQECSMLHRYNLEYAVIQKLRKQNVLLLNRSLNHYNNYKAAVLLYLNKKK